MKKYNSVLLVDDNELDLFIGKAIIDMLEITENLITAKNGIDGLTQLIGHYIKNQSFPELILTDLTMPMMDGIRFIKEIIDLPGFLKSKCKIIVLTTSFEDDKDKKQLENLGIRDILFKPLDKDELLGILSSEK